jgi:FkbM family methyltransferase
MGIVRRLRVLLASRKLFSNWLSAGIKYYLTKVGLLRVDGIGVVCRDGSRGLIPVRAYGVLVNDNYNGYITNYDCKEGIATYMNKVRVPIGELEKGDSIMFDSVKFAVEKGWAYDMVNMFWLKDGIKFRHMYWPIIEIFHYGEYEPLDVNGRVVVDVGAYIGDSAIYFALRGARRVIAIEPHPGAFSEMLDNIKLNNMEGVIIPINAGLASKSGKVCIENIDVSDAGVTYHRPGDCPVTVPAVTLSELINRFSINVDNAALKMDCEGCEFDVILNDYEHVRLFRELILEYHSYTVNKSVDELLNVLSRDYKCDIKGKDLEIMHCIRK